MLNWGVLSTAKIAREHVMPALARASNGRLVALASRERARAAEIAAPYGLRHVFGSYEALLDSSEVDAVYLPLPTADHAAWTLKAIAAGKHVLCEKPIAMEAGEIAAIEAAARARGVLVAEAFMVFYHPQWQAVRRLVSDGAVGRLRRVEGCFTYYNVDPANMRNRTALGGGALRDIGVYPLVTARLATGAEPLRVRAAIERDPAFGTDRLCVCEAEFETFSMGFTVSTQLAHRQTMLFHGEDGTIELTAPFNPGRYGEDTVVLSDRMRGTQTIHRFANADQYRLQAEAFADAALGGSATVFPLSASRANQAAIDALFRAGESGTWEPVAL